MFAGSGAGKYVSHLRAMNLPSLREGGAASVSSARASFPPAEEMEENVVAFGAEGASSNNLEKGVTIVTSPPPGDIAIDGNYDMSERGLAPAKSNAAEKNGLFWKASLDARGGACCADSIESKTEQLLGIVGLRGERWWGEVWGSGWARDTAGCRDAGDARVVGRGGKFWTREAGKDVELPSRGMGECCSRSCACRFAFSLESSLHSSGTFATTQEICHGKWANGGCEGWAVVGMGWIGEESSTVHECRMTRKR